jgi:hypothetical protein
VFFRSQDLDIAAQKVLGQKLGELSGKPSTSGLHTHPTLYTSELGEDISVIDTSQLSPIFNRFGLIAVTATTLKRTNVQRLPPTDGMPISLSKKSHLTMQFSKFILNQRLAATHSGPLPTKPTIVLRLPSVASWRR